jgi:hypothetical protein
MQAVGTCIAPFYFRVHGTPQNMQELSPFTACTLPDMRGDEAQNPVLVKRPKSQF